MLTCVAVTEEATETPVIDTAEPVAEPKVALRPASLTDVAEHAVVERAIPVTPDKLGTGWVS